MSNIVAIVKSLVGQVFAISVEGLKRQIFEGERLLQGEQVMTGLGGEVTLQMANGELVNLGEGNTWQAGSAEAEETDSAPDASLEQALAAGFDPTVDLEAPAAGPGATGGAGGAAGGGHSFVLLDETGLQLDPTIGFPTEGLNFANATSDELAGVLDNGNTADSGTDTGTAGNSGGNGAEGETGQANSAPNALADTFTLDEDGSVAIDVLGNDTDLDGDTLSITQVDGQPIAQGGSVSVSNGSVTLSGNQLVFTPNINYQGPANFTYTISDGALTSTTTVSGTINPVADLSAADDSASGDEDSVINASVTGNDSTSSGGTLSYALASDVSNGSLTFNPDGSYSYTPNANFNGNDSFTYTVTDAASGESRTQTVSLTINPVADLSAADDSASGDEDTVINASVTGNDSTTSGGTLSYALASGVSNGSLTLNADGSYSYTPNANFNGNDSFTYTVTDAATGESLNQTVNLTINPVADLSAADDSASGDEDSVINASVTGNDSTTSGGTLSYALASGVSNGSLTFNPDGSYSYTPNANFNGNDSFTYTVTDAASGESRTQTVSLTINPASPVNNAPTANGTVAEQNDNDADVVSLDVSSFFADVDGDTLTYSASGLPTGLSIDSATGIISGTLDNSASQGGSNGAYSITVTATDPDGASVNQSFTWNVANPAPVAANDTGSADEDNTVTGDVLDNDNDPDGDALSVTQFVVAGDPTTYTAGQNASVEGGTLVINGNGSYSFTPAANWNGTLPTVTYTLSDGEGGSDTATLIITINPVADLSAADDSASGDEDTVINASVTGNDSTTSGGTLSYALASDVSNGSLTFNPDGSYSYTPNANFNGNDSFTYTVTDAASGESRTQTVSLTINPASPVNNAPTANGTVADQNDNDADAVSLDVSSFFADVDGDTLTYSASGLPTGLSIDSATGIISGTLDNSASQGGSNGAYSITVTATDPDGASVEQTFTWNVANPAPVAANDTGSADEDNTVTGDVLDNDNDPDGDALSVTQFVVAGDPTTYTAGQNASVEGGTLVINGNGSYSFTPAANWNGTLPTVTYTLSDGEGGSDTATLIITVNPVNDAPNTNGTVAEQNDSDADAVSLDVSSFFADIDGDTLTYSASGLPTGLSIDSATGIISGTLDNSASQGGSNGAYSITVTATDPDGASVEQTFTWNVANPAPVAANDTGSADEDNTVTGDVLDNDNDPDGDALSVTQFVVAGDPTTYTAGQNASVEGGTLVINGNGSYSFTPAANWNGTLPTVTYSLSDGEGGSDTATLIITVNPVNDAPSISAPDFIAAVEDISTPLTGISFSDIDAAGDVVATLTVASGTLSANSGAGVLVSGAGDTLSLTGSIADINAFIAAAQVSYTGAQDASGDVDLTLSLDDNGNTGSGGAQIASTTSVIQIAPVADAPIINLTLGAVVETTTTIDSSNAQSTDQGFTISAFSVNGNPGSISLNNSPLGFGVAGGASGNNVELGQNATGTERLNVVFDTAIASATVRFAWLSTVESAEYKLFDSNGLQIGGAIVSGVTDVIDPAITLTGTDGALISRIEFTAAAGVGNDYLINSISYVTSSSYPLTISVTPTDIDNSESISAVAVSIPNGATFSVGEDNGDGTWSLPLVSDGSYVVAVDPVTQAMTISGLEMTIPGSVSGTPELITTATVVDGSDSVNAIFGSAGNDLINGSPDDDILSGGLGNDSLNGGADGDTFLWRAGDTGNDVIGDFNVAEGDRIDLSDLLQAENQSNILDYLRVDMATSTLEISTTGSLDVTGADVTIKLENGGVAVDLSSYGATSSDIVNSLIAGADPLVKVDHT